MYTTLHPCDIVEEFEDQVAGYANAPFAVAVDSCTHALFLACKYLKVDQVSIPKHTYVSVPAEIIHAGGSVEFTDVPWNGVYQLYPYPIWDAAKRFRGDMFGVIQREHAFSGTEYEHTFVCVSFHHAKILPAGRGGMILHNSPEADNWFRLARHSGRHERTALADDKIEVVGWHYTMDPMYAVNGLKLMSRISNFNNDQEEVYPDLSQYECFKDPRREQSVLEPKSS